MGQRLEGRGRAERERRASAREREDEEEEGGGEEGEAWGEWGEYILTSSTLWRSGLFRAVKASSMPPISL